MIYLDKLMLSYLFVPFKHLIHLEYLLLKLLVICMIILALTCILLFFLLKLTAIIVKNLSDRKYLSERNESLDSKRNPFFTIGFFHPFCYSGGGGERVLWSAVKVLQDT